MVAAIIALSLLTICLCGCSDTSQYVTAEQWVGEYAFFESASAFKNMRYQFSIIEEAGEHTAHCYIFGYKTLNEFRASVAFGRDSVDFIFDEYVDMNLSEPFKKGDTLLSLKIEKDKLLTNWGVVKPMVKENSTARECFYSVSSQYGGELDIWNKESPLLGGMFLIDESEKGGKGFLYLGMPRDTLISALDENGIRYNMTDIETEAAGSYAVVFYLFDNCISIHLSQDKLDSIDIIGSIPLETTESQAGLKLGDTFDRMVALYGNDYTETDLAEVADVVTGTHYKYDLGEHHLEIWFETDTVSAWGISA